MKKILFIAFIALTLILIYLLLIKQTDDHSFYDFIFNFDKAEKINFDDNDETNEILNQQPMLFDRALIMEQVRSLFSINMKILYKNGRIINETDKGIDKGGFRFLLQSSRMKGKLCYYFKKKDELNYWSLEFTFNGETSEIIINRYEKGAVKEIEKFNYQIKGRTNRIINLMFFSDFLILANRNGVFFQMRDQDLNGKGGIGLDCSKMTTGEDDLLIKFAQMTEKAEKALVTWHDKNQPLLKAYKINTLDGKKDYIIYKQSINIDGKKNQYLNRIKIGNVVRPSILFRMNASLKYSVKVPENGVLEFHLFIVPLHVYQLGRLIFIADVEQISSGKTKRVTCNFGSLQGKQDNFVPFLLDLKDFGGSQCRVKFQFITSNGKLFSDEERINLVLASPAIYSERKDNEYNVILISLDTLRASSLGCYGYPRETSRNLDEFAKSGTLCRNVSSTSSWTLPAHMSMFTALYPMECGFDKNEKYGKKSYRFTMSNIFIPDEIRTIPEYLQRAGYKTIGIHGGGYLSEIYGFDKGFISYERMRGDVKNAVNLAIKSLDRIKKNKFFLFFHTYEIHDPYKHDYFLSQLTDLEKTHENEIIAKYDSGIRYTDVEIGRLIEWLKNNGLFEKTLIIITSDHGENFTNLPKTANSGSHGHTLYDAETHIPLILGGAAKFSKSSIIKNQASLADILPTILDFLNIPIEKDVRGASLIPFIDDKSSINRIAFSEGLFTVIEKKSIRSLNYKLIAAIKRRNTDGSLKIRYELYDLQKDSKEKEDILYLKPTVAKDYIKYLNNILKSIEENRAKLAKSSPAKPKHDKELLEDLKGLGYIGN